MSPSYSPGQTTNEHVFMRHLLALKDQSKSSDQDTERAQSNVSPADASRLSLVAGVVLLVAVAMVIGLMVLTWYKKRLYDETSHA